MRYKVPGNFLHWMAKYNQTFTVCSAYKGSVRYEAPEKSI
jgi:hypothetical protein